ISLVTQACADRGGTVEEVRSPRERVVLERRSLTPELVIRTKREGDALHARCEGRRRDPARGGRPRRSAARDPQARRALDARRGTAGDRRVMGAFDLVPFCALLE